MENIPSTERVDKLIVMVKEADVLYRSLSEDEQEQADELIDLMDKK